MELIPENIADKILSECEIKEKTKLKQVNQKWKQYSEKNIKNQIIETAKNNHIQIVKYLIEENALVNLKE